MWWSSACLALLTLAWVFSINLTWYLVRLYHKSSPPGRQTVVTDLICYSTYFSRLNACITSSLYLYLSVSEQPSPSMVLISLGILLWEVSLLVLCGLANCLSLIRLSVAHGLTWVHEWSSGHLHAVFGLISLLHVTLVVALDLYKGNKNLVGISFPSAKVPKGPPKKPKKERTLIRGKGDL